MSIIFAIVLALIVCWFLIVPHLNASPDSCIQSWSEQAENASDRKTRCLQSLNDLEHDFATDKLSEKDYQQTRKILVAELDDRVENKAN